MRSGIDTARVTGQRWVWVTRPQFYLDDDGQDRADLDPARGYTPEGWWTCHPDTRDGDLAVVYRSRVAKDIGYLVAVRSDAEQLDDASSDFDGWSVCRYQILARFERPVTIDDMRADDVLSKWAALRASFVRRAFPVPDVVWDRLLERLGTDAEQLRAALVSGGRRFRLERQLQQCSSAPAATHFASWVGGCSSSGASTRAVAAEPISCTSRDRVSWVGAWWWSSSAT